MILLIWKMKMSPLQKKVDQRNCQTKHKKAQN